MAVSKDEIKEALSQLPVLELVDLISELEEEWGGKWDYEPDPMKMAEKMST